MTDLHTHTVFSDGKNTPEQMVLSAIGKGVTTYGISDHSYTPFDQNYCMRPENYAVYKAEIEELKEKYKNETDLRCGIELDYYSHKPDIKFDYTIGSVHYVKAGNVYIPVDFTKETLENAVSEYFGGDFFSLIEKYYENVADVVNKTKCDIIGHFDLITKFNEGKALFDESDKRYKDAYKTAADALLKTGVPFEINFGAISRGYRKTPYPSKEIFSYLKKNGAEFILSSDGHSAENICYGFDTFKGEL